MAHPRRLEAPVLPASDADFNQQIYSALQAAPWWTISLALHVLAFLLLGLIGIAKEPAAPPRAVQVAASEEPLPPDVPPIVDPPEDVRPHAVVEPNPEPRDHEIPEVPEDDVDMPFSETLGAEGTANAPFDGPAQNATIGVGPGAGSPFGRRGSNRDRGGPAGAPPRFDDAVEDALRWLAAHQSPGGGWEAAGFDRWCDGQLVGDPARRPDGLGKALYDPGVTGLALCAFLGAGYTNRGRHPFAKVVSRGLGYLKNVQDPEGCFGPRATQQYIYNHATAALAMVEAYGMTGSPILKGSAQRGLDFLALSRNPYLTWRYGIKPGDNDTSVTGWMMMALKSAEWVNRHDLARGRPAALAVDQPAFDGIRAWLDRVTDEDTGRVGYTTRGSGPARPQGLVDRFPGERSEALTAVGVLARVFLGEDPRKSTPIRRGAELCRRLPPTWNPDDGSIDMYYWYYGTLAMFQVGGPAWAEWKKALERAVVDTQRKDTDPCRYRGSWDPIGPWGPDGGRVYSTALLAMCLEVYHRYERVFGAR